MELDPSTREDLAAFFAKRFPRAEDRVDLAHTAQVPVGGLPTAPLAAWAELLDRAIAKDRVLALLDAALAAAPDDRNLLEVRRLLAPPSKGPAPAWSAAAALAPLAAAALLVVVASGVWLVRGAGEGEPPRDGAPAGAAAAVGGAEPAEGAATAGGAQAEAPPEAAGATPAPGAMPEGGASAGAAEAAEAVASAAREPVPAEAREPAREPVAAGEREPARVAAPPTTEPTTRAAPVGPAGCTGPAGEILGWWYVAGDSPGAVGDTVTVAKHANVRVDYPRRDNGFSKGARVICTLAPGMRQRLSHAPVGNGAGSWWVPLAGDDLER